MISSLKTKKEIDFIFQKGKKYKLNFGYLIYHVPDQKPESKSAEIRVLIAVKKKLGKAVARNRSRRIVREALRKIAREKKIKQDVYMAVILNRADLKFDDVYNELWRFFEHRVGVVVD